MRSLNRKHMADVSGCISTLIGNGVKSKHRSLFFISGDNIKEKIVKLHTIVGDTSTVLWCSKDKLSLQGKKRKSSFNKFLKSIVLTECLYKDSQRVLGNTFGMCILQDFEALTPVLLQRTIDTMVGGGLIILLLPSSSPLEDLEAMAMFCTESRTHATWLFNLRFRSSIACSKACVAMDDNWSISTISSHIKSIAPVPVPDKEGCEGLLDDINSLMDEHHENVFVAHLVKNCCTLDQGKAVVTFLDVICDKTVRDNIALLAARGLGKSAALGLAVAGAVAAGPENLKSLFEFVLRGFDSLEYKEYIDYKVFRSTDHKFHEAIVQIDIHKQHRQTIQYIQPHEQERLFRVELLVVDEVAAIPTAVVKSLLGPYLVFISSITCNGYEGTDRSLTLLRQLTEQNQMSKDLNVSLSGRIFKKIELNEPIRYASGDPIDSWLNGLLCLDAANDIVDSTRGSLNNLEKSELYYVNRGTLFRYQGQSELFLQRMMALFAASQFENSPIDQQLMADAPEHHFFVLLGPVDESKKHQPDILCVIQVSLEGKISQESAERSLKAFHFPHGDEISWKFCELFQNTYFPSLSGARILRIATHPNIMQSEHYSVAHHAVELLTRYFEGQWDSISDMDDTDCINKPPVSIVPAAEKLLSPKEPRTDLPPPLEHLCSEHLEKVHYICVSFGLTLGLLEFWRRQNFEPFYVGQIPNDVTGEHTCLVLKHIQAVNIQWGCVYQDFKQRFSRLLSSSFCSMDYNLAMSVLDPTINFAKSEAAKSNIDKVLEEHISFLDLKRLQFYVNNSADFPRIEDLVHVFSHLYFQGRIPITLSLNQASVLLCAGLQRRDISHIERQLNLDGKQILSLLIDAMNFFSEYLSGNATKESESTLLKEYDFDEQLKTVWLVEVNGNLGGAFCIDSAGLLITCLHVLSCNDLEPDEIFVRGYSDYEFRRADLVKSFKTLDIALIRLRKEPDEVFSAISLADHIRVDRSDMVVGHVHCQSLPFSSMFGNVSYPYLSGSSFEYVFGDIDLSLGECGDLQDYRMQLDTDYRTILGCVDSRDSELNTYHPYLPLVQVEKFGLEGGASGCPLFKESNGELIGMFLFRNSCYHFVVPVDFIRCLVERLDS